MMFIQHLYSPQESILFISRRRISVLRLVVISFSAWKYKPVLKKRQIIKKTTGVTFSIELKCFLVNFHHFFFIYMGTLLCKQDLRLSNGALATCK